MNNKRRKKIAQLIQDLNALKETCDILFEEEDTAYQNLPESLQSTDKAGMMEACSGSLCEAAESIQSAIDSLEEI